MNLESKESTCDTKDANKHEDEKIGGREIN